MKVNLLFILLSVTFFVGCKFCKECDSLNLYEDENYLVKEVEVYEVKEWLYPILDSVIMQTEKAIICQRFANEITFIFEIEFNGSVNSVDLVISVEDSIDSFDRAIWTDAVFFYEGYKFYCGRTFLDSFFKKNSATIYFTCISPKKYQWNISERSGEKLEWFYCIEMEND